MSNHSQTLFSARPATSTCPLCGADLHPALFAYHHQLTAAVIRELHSANAHWVRSDGVCPQCAYQAAERVAAAHSVTSLHGELQLPYPVFSRDALDLLPTPERLRAHPDYTGRRVTIAFLDSGFYPHPDLARPTNRIVRYVDATDTVPVEVAEPKVPRIEKWHGTMNVGGRNIVSLRTLAEAIGTALGEPAKIEQASGEPPATVLPDVTKLGAQYDLSTLTSLQSGLQQMLKPRVSP